MPSEPPSTSRRADGPPKPKNEQEFLKRQADDAVVAMGSAFREFKQKMKHAVSLETAAKDHPWWTVAAGVVAGFATAVTIVPSKRESELKELAKLQRALHPDAPESSNPAGGNAAGSQQSSVGQTLVKEAMALVRPVAMNAISAYIASQKTPETPESSEVPAQESTLT